MIGRRCRPGCPDGPAALMSLVAGHDNNLHIACTVPLARAYGHASPSGAGNTHHSAPTTVLEPQLQGQAMRAAP